MKRNIQNVKKRVAKPVPAATPGKDHSFWILSFSILLVLIAYLPVFNAGFVNWDDDDYVLKNKAIRSFANIKELLTSSVQGNYHPLTMLTLAMNYAISGLNPFSYHLLNLVIHLLNTFLVYRLASLLSRNNNIIAFTTALLFGIHPLHVESVAWVSERKDVLYAFFFLLGLIYYCKYVEKGLRKDLLITFCWFLLSILSKPAAIIFPATLFVFDFFYSRKATAKVFLEKIPFFLLSAVFAFLTLYAQKTVGATDRAEVFTVGNRIMFGFYGYAMYFLKMLFPVNLVAFYPTPPVNVPLPAYFYATPLFFIATVVAGLATWKKNRVIAFGFAFYLINLLLVLQFVVIGSALIAERYTYIPLIGLFYLIGWYLNRTFHARSSIAYSIIACIGIVLGIITYNQAGTWKSGEALWENAIKKVPSAKAYALRAADLNKKGNKEKALSYFNEAIKLNKADPEAFVNRGNIYFNSRQDSLAFLDYNSALALNPDFALALSNMGALYSTRENYEEGLSNLNRALTLEPDLGPAYKNRATTYMGMKKFDSAISDFRKYLEFEPDEIEIYNAIGVCYQNLGKYDQSVAPFSDAIARDPLPTYFLNRSLSFNALGRIGEARKDALEAKSRGLKLNPEYEKILGL